jgi:hypothetical protein
MRHERVNPSNGELRAKQLTDSRLFYEASRGNSPSQDQYSLMNAIRKTDNIFQVQEMKGRGFHVVN